MELPLIIFAENEDARISNKKITMFSLIFGLSLGVAVGIYVGYKMGYGKLVSWQIMSVPVSPSHERMPDDKAHVNINLKDGPSEYKAHVIQLGGGGSRIHQKNAYVDDENQYLISPEEWVFVTFTRGEAMWVACCEGYTVKTCAVDGDLTKGSIDKAIGCFYEFPGRIPRTDVEVTCGRREVTTRTK